MSGYLQRLAASVLKPSAAIHPILGSVFSPPPQPVPAEHEELFSARSAAAETPRSAPAVPLSPSIEHDTADTSALPHAPVRERAGFRASIDPPQWRPEPALPASSDIETTEHAGLPRSSRPEPDREPSRPALGQHPIVPWNRSQPRSTDPTTQARDSYAAATPAASRAEPAVPERNSPPVAATPEPPLQDFETRVYRPLIEPSFQRQTPPAILPETFREARNTDRRDSPRPQALPQHEPDEIRIHIGRIEVVAAVPAPVHAAPRPVRPSPDLGDYLKRRNGRA